MNADEDSTNLVEGLKLEHIINYTYDHMSLITAAVLIKKKFTIEEIIQNY